MTHAITRLPDDALALQAAAQRLHDDVTDRACAPLVPAALTAIEQSLQTLSRACYAAAQTFVPVGGHDESIAQRYARAADAWPFPRDGSAPSYERQVRVLSSLHDAGAALRTAAGHCERAGSNLAETMDPMAELRELPRRRPPAAA